MIDSMLVKLSSIIKDESTAEVVEKVATKTAYIASGVTVFSGLTVNEWGVVVGAIIGIVTLAFNIWFKMKYLIPENRGKSKISERRKKPRGSSHEQRKPDSFT